MQTIFCENINWYTLYHHHSLMLSQQHLVMQFWQLERPGTCKGDLPCCLLPKLLCDLWSVANDFRIRKISSMTDCVAKMSLPWPWSCLIIRVISYSCIDMFCALSQHKPLQNWIFQRALTDALSESLTWMNLVVIQGNYHPSRQMVCATRQGYIAHG